MKVTSALPPHFWLCRLCRCRSAQAAQVLEALQTSRERLQAVRRSPLRAFVR